VNDVKETFSFSTVAIVVVLLLVAGTGTTTILTATYAQTNLGEPFFEESGQVTGQKEIGPNTMHITFAANGTLKGNIEVTNTGDFISVSKGDNLFFDQGQGAITTIDGSETANYTIIAVGNVTQDGKQEIQGAAAYSTDSTGKLAFLNNILGIFKAEVDETGGFVSNEWQWK
jgi:hypothetical protein